MWRAFGADLTVSDGAAMTKLGHVSKACVIGGALVCGLAAATRAQAGAFGVREQSAYFLGSTFAGSAAGNDISSMFWNSAAAASRSGCNFSANLTAVFGRADETAQAGLFVTGAPPIAPGLTPTSTDVGTSAVVPSSYATCQITERLYAGLGVNGPFGFLTKPDASWAGSPIAVTSKIFSTDFNPTVAYKLTPELTIGVGLQVEYIYLKLNHGPFNTVLGSPLTGSRGYEADDWGFGATAGLLWQPTRATSIGLGYRSAVGVDVSGDYAKTPGLLTGPAISTSATASLMLPDEVTLSMRQSVAPQLALLGTIEWQNWSRVQNVTATSAGCTGGACEVLNLNYRDGWFYSIGAEYAYRPGLTLRTGIAYETSPIQDSTRDILLPDSDRIHVGVGASYAYSDRVTVDVGYSHLFFQDGSFCIANAALNRGTSHCTAATPAGAVLLSGKADVSTDLLAFGLKYKF
jgi:long-chain fatty acid transport protein